MLVKLQITDPVINKKRYYTTAALKDELTKQLSSTTLEIQANSKNNDINTVYKYHKYAQKLLYEINLLKPTPVFEISIADLSQELVQELQMLHEEILNEVVIDAISRLYHNMLLLLYVYLDYLIYLLCQLDHKLKIEQMHIQSK